MAALVPARGGQSHTEERKRLVENVHKAVKQCQARFGGRTELATETDTRVAALCRSLECALAHGLRVRPLKNNNSALKQMTDIVSSSLNFARDSNQSPAFWHYVREHLTRHEYERYQMLKQIWTDAGRGRAWLRSSLNEKSLERYLHCLLGTPNLIANFYEEWALMQDEESSSTLPNMARGLDSILFAISIDKVELNHPIGPESPSRLLEPIVGAPLPTRPMMSHSEPSIGSSSNDENACNANSQVSAAPKERRRRRLPPKIISFDDANVGQSTVTKPANFTSAPTTCMNSPVALSVGSYVDRTPSTLVADPSVPSDSEMPSKTPQTPSVTITKASEVLTQLGSESNVTQGKEGESLNVANIVDQEESPSQSPTTQTKLPHQRESRLPSPSPSTSPLPLSLSSSPVVTSSHLQTLTPVNNVSVGELIPVSLNEEAHSEEDSLSVPSYSEDTDCAAAALLATQRLLQNTSFDYTSPEQPSASVRAKSKVDLPPHVNGEVKEAVLSVLIRKEELEKENHTLRHSLERSTEELAALQAKLVESERFHHEKTGRIESRLQALERENDLLKHQLRKYVGAVQMLRKDGAQAHEMLSQLAGGCVITDGPDYHHEAREYEKKLIQVAEMHGELMEFNDRLQRALQAREAALRRLRDELIDLRGPLPDEPGTSDDDANSITSDYDGGSIGTAARTLVNIWVPSAFLTGGSSDVHHVYQVFIRIREDEWNIYRRYAQFYALHKDLKKQDPVVGTFDFPPKKALGNKDARFVEERRRRLQHYLRCVMNHLIQTNADLAATPDKDLLVHLVPFFGEMCNVGDDRSGRRRASSRNPFTRLTRVIPDPSAAPQYTGL